MDTTSDCQTEPKTVKPFLKWAGGKSQLLPQMRDHLPKALTSGDITRYTEPFLGGGAVFLDFAQRYPIRSADLGDINPEIVLVYRVVQQSPAELIERLDAAASAYLPMTDDERKSYYYDLRERYNQQRSSIDYTRYSDAWIRRAVYMIFLNKTCYNGLYRVNSKGGFNVPYGRYDKPAIYNAEEILRASKLLDIAEIRQQRFDECSISVDTNSFVYFDPPYRPITHTANFTAYTRYRFADEEQTQLAHFYRRLHEETGASLMLSNSDPKNADPTDEFFDELYDGFHIHRVFANRMINSNVRRRGKVSELLITNY